MIYLTGSAAGYWWLRCHEAVRAARQRRDDLAADLADRKLWHEILPRAGLDGWHVQWRRATNLGEERLITTSPENALATRIAANSAAIAEKLAHILGLPYGRIDFTTTDYPGQLIIGIRTVDLSVRDAAYHPMTTPWPETEPSPFTGWFPRDRQHPRPDDLGVLPRRRLGADPDPGQRDRRPGGRGDRRERQRQVQRAQRRPRVHHPVHRRPAWCSSTARTWAMRRSGNRCRP